jgi:RNA polymerase sigma factor (sigma-70 family)
MATRQLSGVLQHLRSIVSQQHAKGMTDGRLLELFITHKHEAAFEALVRRHGPMVLAVCRRVLHNLHDAEDAFQATFLVLVRKAASIRPRTLVGNWLYGVAYRTSLEARRAMAKRRAKEKQVSEMPRAETANDIWAELRAVLDHELDRLPDKYRAVLVLCDLEGKARKEVAQQLGWPEGTVASRLARAREMLAKRLTRHGLALSAGSLAVALSGDISSACLPAPLVSSTIKAATLFAAGKAAATGVISAKVVAMTEGVMKTMLLSKLKITTAVMLTLGVVATTAGLAGHHALQTQRPNAKPADTEKPDTERSGVVMADKDKLQGTWAVVSAERLGKKIMEGPLRQVAYIFKGDTVTYKDPNGEQSGTFRLYPTQKPRAIDMTLDGETIRAIYKLSDDTLTLAGFGEARPVDFNGDGVATVFILKRTKLPEGTATGVSGGEPVKPIVGEPPAAFTNAPGWAWYQAPKPRQGFGHSGASADVFGGGFSYILAEDKDGAPLVYLAFSKSESISAYRPVIFDAERKRYLLKPTGGGGHNNVSLSGFRLDPQVLPASKAVYLGVEILTAKGHKIQAKEVFDQAKKTGVEVLPFPETQAVYEFVLTTMDGKTIRSRDLLGKVVLIDCWATWCSPCMAKMPQLKELYEKHHKDGLEIVGVCFDHDADKARKTAKSKGLDWPQVFVPADEKMRSLWEEATGIGALPRLLLLDRSGVLRADCGPGELKDQIGKLLDENSKP